jgi:hypothetical protein
MQEIERIWDRYRYLDPMERMFMVVEELSRKAVQMHDHTQLPSHNELAKIFDGIFVNSKTGQPTYIPAILWIKRLLSYIRKDKGHPHIRPYTEMHVEELADGTEVVRNYVNFLRGKKAVIFVNQRLEIQKMGLEEIQKQNRDLEDVRTVSKEVDLYRMELELKNRDAKKRKGRK